MRIDQINKVIPKTLKTVSVHFANGSIRQIMKVIMLVINKDELESQVAKFVLSLLRDNNGNKEKTLKALWQIVKKDIRYIPDGFGVQDIKHPARTWHDGFADCKSMTVFIYFCCRVLDIPCYIRFTSYTTDKVVGHVYPIAILNNEEIILDAVYDWYDAEPDYTHKVDKYSKIYSKQKIKKAMTQIREIAGIRRVSGYSRNQMQDITMTLQQKGKLTLPKSPRYNLSGETEGVILAQLKAEKHNKLGLIATARGDQNRAAVNFRLRDQFANLGQPNLHQYGAKIIQTTGLDNYSAAKLKKFANSIQRLEKRATNSSKRQLRDRISGQGIYGPYDIYEPDDTDRNQCSNIATERVRDLWGNIIYEDGFTFNQGVYDTCMTGKYMENLVNAHMKKAGSTYLYHMMPENVLYYSNIASKKLRQKEWALDISAATGLSLSIIEGFFDNGITDVLEYDAEEAYVLFHPAMTIGQNQIGIAPAVIAAIISGVVALTGSIAAAVVENNRIKAAAQAKKDNAFQVVEGMNPLIYAPGEGDFDTNFGNNGGGGSGGGNNGGGSGGGGNSDGGGIDPTTMLLLGLGAYVALK